MSKGKPDESMLEQMAMAIYGSAVSQARRVVEEKDLQIERLKRVFEAADSESDRSAAILIFALAEDLMLESLKANLNPRAWGNGKDVAGPNGPLGTAANRLVVLNLLYWIRDKTAENLKCLKAIRNHFAHHPDIVSFDDPKIAALVGQLQHWEGPVQEGLIPLDEQMVLSNRDKYLLRASCTVAQLASDLAVGPAATSHNVNPADVEGKTFDDLVDNLRSVRFVMAEVMLRTLKREVPVAKGTDA